MGCGASAGSRYEASINSTESDGSGSSSLGFAKSSSVLSILAPRKKNRLPSVVQEEDEESEGDQRVIFLDVVLLGPDAAEAAELAASSRIEVGPMVEKKALPGTDGNYMVTCKVDSYVARVRLHPISYSSQSLPKFRGAFGTSTAYVVLLPIDRSDVDFHSGVLAQRLDEARFQHSKKGQPVRVAHALLGVHPRPDDWHPFRPLSTQLLGSRSDLDLVERAASEVEASDCDASADIVEPDWYQAFRETPDLGARAASSSCSRAARLLAAKLAAANAASGVANVRVLPLSDGEKLCEALVEAAARFLIDSGAVIEEANGGGTTHEQADPTDEPSPSAPVVVEAT